MYNTKTDILSMDLPELTRFIKSLGEPRYRAAQVYMWFHKKTVFDYAKMSSLPEALRERLAEEAPISPLIIKEKHTSKLDGSVKYLFGAEGGSFETVYIQARYGNTVCVSSQIGCGYGCLFCASGKNGLTRDLTAGEMLRQIYALENDIGDKITNAVIMGMGEPLCSLKNLTRFITVINSREGRNMSARNITVSTCGLVPVIYKLADLKTGVSLAISLHAPDDELRKKLMPKAAKYSINELIEAADYYFLMTGRRVSFEYMLIKGVNDRRADAYALAALLKDKNTFVNVLMYNDIKTNGIERSGAGDVFISILKERGINANMRRSAGYDINAACGQLISKIQEG